MSEIEWTRVYGGRVRHAFTYEYREYESPLGNKYERKTLCNKWFKHHHSRRDYWAQAGYKKCKQCKKRYEQLEKAHDNTTNS